MESDCVHSLIAVFTMATNGMDYEEAGENVSNARGQWLPHRDLSVKIGVHIHECGAKWPVYRGTSLPTCMSVYLHVIYIHLVCLQL